MDERRPVDQSPGSSAPEPERDADAGSANGGAAGEVPAGEVPTGEVPGGAVPIDPADPMAAAFDAAGDPLPAAAFAPGLDDAALGVAPITEHRAACGWCGASLRDPAATTCPNCGAALQPTFELPEIPGVNVAPVDVRRAVRTVDPEILALVAAPVADGIARPGTRPALEPPDASIRRLMLQLELEAKRPAAVADATGVGGSVEAGVDGERAEPSEPPPSAP